MAKLDPTLAAAGPLVRGYTDGGFRVDDAIHSAVLLTPLAVHGWNAPELAALDLLALRPLMALDPPPEFVLLGTGATLHRPAPAFVAALEARGVGLEVMDSRAAARAWGVLRAEGRWIAAALMPLSAQ